MMEFRKLIGFGKSSFVVSIPKNWTQKNKLNKGDIIYLREEDNALVLSAKEKRLIKEPKRITIRTESKSVEKLQAEIIAAYLENVPPGTNIWWFAYESVMQTGTYTKIHESFAPTGGGSGYFESDPMLVQPISLTANAPRLSRSPSRPCYGPSPRSRGTPRPASPRSNLPSSLSRSLPPAHA